MTPGTLRGSAAGLPAAGGHNGGPCWPQAPSHLNFHYDPRFPICKTRQHQDPGPALPQALDLGEPAPSVPAASCTGPSPTQRGSLGQAQPQGSRAAGIPAGQGSGHSGGPRPVARWQGQLQICGSALGLSLWPPAGQGCPSGSRPELQRGGTHSVIQMAVLWSPRHEKGCPSNISGEMSFHN